MSSQSNYFVHTLLRARDWQHRPQFEQVCDWWHNGGRGVCALVGMGGAGKTAVADRFLNVLLDGTSTTRQRISPPQSVFVYSFYDDDKPENFFHHLQIWLEGTSAPKEQKSPTQLMFDIQQHKGLIILDGLEKVQASGVRGGFGRLTSPSLRDLLNHIAAGDARELSVLVTSRFPLTDLRDSQPRYFHTIAVDQIDVAAGVALLRARGVRGTDVQLSPIIEHCGRHALTVDLAGGYIKEYGHGDPFTPLNLGDDLDKTVEEREAEADEELDDDKRAVLKQGIRFARIAQRYREAMLDNDEAVLALLERICLFRLGVDCETLAAIFTGSGAERVSGKALASLDADQLQRKLEWLVRMRIVERTKPKLQYHLAREDPNQNLRPETGVMPVQAGESVYTIHPAVRDGFLSGLGRSKASASHKAVRDYLEVSLADVPRDYTSDPVRLDLLEEIIYHSLAAGEYDNALALYFRRMGGFHWLGWKLGQFERGRRVTSELVDAGTPTASIQNNLGLYLAHLGDVNRGIRCFESGLELLDSTGDSLANREFHDRDRLRVWLLQNTATFCILAGRLVSSGDYSNNAARIGRSISYIDSAFDSHVSELHASWLRGSAGTEWPAPLADSSQILSADPSANDGRLATLHFLRMGYRALCYSGDRRIVALVIAACERLQQIPEHLLYPDCRLVLSEKAVHDGKLDLAREFVAEAVTWGIQRDAKEALCWSALVKARIERSALRNERSLEVDGSTAACANAQSALRDGLKIARDCGFGLYHIDLLLERARSNLLQGDPQSALEDVELALDNGIPANEQTGQPELLAADDEECGYAWAIPPGLQLRGEAQLLRAAQQHGSDSFVPAKLDELPDEVKRLIAEGRKNLEAAMDRWQPLRDPVPESENQNFRHPESGEAYNYRAGETWHILDDLNGGILTRYPLAPLAELEPEDDSTTEPDLSEAKMGFDVFLSHNSKDKPAVRDLKQQLVGYKLTVWYDEDELRPGIPWRRLLEEGIRSSASVAVLIGKDGLGPWEDEEMQAALQLAVKDKRPIIPVLLADAPLEPDLPMFLGNRTWVDLRGGSTADGLGKLVWGITGKKPNPQ